MHKSGYRSIPKWWFLIVLGGAFAMAMGMYGCQFHLVVANFVIGEQPRIMLETAACPGGH
jgi:hypothetical protein